MESIEQVRELYKKVIATRKALEKDWPEDLITESEVKLRYDALLGVLLVFQNDVAGMVMEWEK